jgi:hypothetical protein
MTDTNRCEHTEKFYYKFIVNMLDITLEPINKRFGIRKHNYKNQRCICEQIIAEYLIYSDLL